MKATESTPGRFAFLTVLLYTLLLVWCLTLPGIAFADDPPPPPPPPDTPTFTPTPEDPTDTPTPSNTPTPTDTATPTNTSTATNTSTPTSTPASTDTPLPTDASESTHTPGPVGTAGPQSTGNPDCQSVVTGNVFDASGGPARGVTVLIQGADWSRATATNDTGQYGFNQLCPGMATLQAFLPEGQVSQLAELDLNGRDNVHVQLNVAIASTSSAEQTPTSGPDMPVTGNEGWLLLGAALLAVLLLAVAGTRRALTVRERSEERD